MTVVILGVDPGESCGLAELTDGALTYIFQGPPENMIGHLRGRLAHALLQYEGDLVLTVVCERFIERKGPGIHMTNQPKPLMVIGMVEEICTSAGITFVLQNPSDAKSMAQNDRLRKLGLWVLPSQLGTADANDARDAIRHAVLRLATKHASIFSRLLRDAGD